jgi:phosphomannomutase
LAEDHTDGLRLSLQNNQTLHIRPSGNAPELRLYAEARTGRAAQALLASAIAQTRIALDTIAAQDTNLLEQHTSRKDKT